jgi:hypothetical protein
LTLTFSQAIPGLSAGDITLGGVSSVNKGALSGSGPTYTLPISGFTAGGSLTVSVAKSGYTISGGPKSVTIFYNSGTLPDGGSLSFTLINDDTEYKVSIGTARGAIVIPSVYNGLPVTAIADYGFSGWTIITSVTIPDSVTSIGFRAFAGCTGLRSLTIGNGVTSIGRGVFESCSGLTSVTIPASVTSIVNGAFENCSGLESITVTSGNTVYRSEGNCIIEISNNTLRLGCKNSVIPDSVTTIGAGSFAGCTGLTSITIPVGVTSFLGDAFVGCSGLTSVSVASGNTKYRSEGNCIIGNGNSLILGCKNSVIPASVTIIGDWAFDGCTGLTSVTIPASVTGIYQQAFHNCTGLTSVTFATGSNIPSRSFNYSAFPGDLTTVYLTGGAGTYTRAAGGETWTKQ